MALCSAARQGSCTGGGRNEKCYAKQLNSHATPTPHLRWGEPQLQALGGQHERGRVDIHRGGRRQGGAIGGIAVVSAVVIVCAELRAEPVRGLIRVRAG
jgi:hypothetical protein